MQIIDAHHHLWQISRGDYHWMTEDALEIRSDYLPRDLEKIAKPLGVVGTVLVQAAATVAETEFLLDLARRHRWILGVVGWVDLEDPDCIATLERLADGTKLKGIRPMLQDIAQTDWVLQPNVIEALHQVSKMGLRFDALIQPRHLSVIKTLAETVPELPIVIDHCAKPNIAGGLKASRDWYNQMTDLSQFPQVYCKLSGLANEHGPGWEVHALGRVAEHVLAEFGAARVMWGSDWPVLELAGDYRTWLECAQGLSACLEPPEREFVFGKTAELFYGLAD